MLSLWVVQSQTSATHCNTLPHAIDTKTSSGSEVQSGVFVLVIQTQQLLVNCQTTKVIRLPSAFYGTPYVYACGSVTLCNALQRSATQEAIPLPNTYCAIWTYVRVCLSHSGTHCSTLHKSHTVAKRPSYHATCMYVRVCAWLCTFVRSHVRVSAWVYVCMHMYVGRKGQRMRSPHTKQYRC